MALKAIETRYKGYRFRSRLEARWAVFFDALGVRWQYEPEGFDLDGVWYLPDFWLSDLECWAEVKPVRPTLLEISKVQMLQEATGQQVLLIAGDPWPSQYTVLTWAQVDGPHDAECEIVDCSRCRAFETRPYWFNGFPIQHDQVNFAECRRCAGWCLCSETEYETWAMNIGPHTCGDHDRFPLPTSDRMMRAYEAARAARFEHGETPGGVRETPALRAVAEAARRDHPQWVQPRWQVGDLVVHQQFGNGKVVQSHPGRELVVVRFESAGVRKFVNGCAPLTKREFARPKDELYERVYGPLAEDEDDGKDWMRKLGWDVLDLP